jgi:hypothetical protein
MSHHTVFCTRSPGERRRYGKNRLPSATETGKIG